MENKGLYLADWGCKEGEEKARLMIRLDHNSEKLRIWDSTGQFVDIDFSDIPSLINEIKDPHIPRNSKYFKEKFKIADTPPTQP